MKTSFTLPRKTLSAITVLMIALLSYHPIHAQKNTTPVSNESRQDFTVKGNVSDENGPLLGASVTLKGNSTVGVVTDDNGAFTFPKALKAGDVLVFSFLGYEMKEVKIQKNMNFLKVVLETDLVEILGALESNEPYSSKRNH
ncbi:MAG: carboxypeptidase-like regulatory domain-containing protein [Psychroserpens sp.]|uniref:carboxypeptidase-like regulatory domain-containing protein n=1 Tax=Psychroserpens sp. TaxID=2020870 RepID=UPI003C945435